MCWMSNFSLSHNRERVLIVVCVRVGRCDGVRLSVDQVGVLQSVPLVDRDRGAALAHIRIDSQLDGYAASAE